MKKADVYYFSQNISSLSGIPIRIYKGSEVIASYSMGMFPCDPFSLYEAELLETGSPARCFITPQFQYYGIIQSRTFTVVIGPSHQIPPRRQTIVEIGFLLGIEETHRESFMTAIQSIPAMSLEGFAQIICFIHDYLNNERLTLKDLLISDETQEDIRRSIDEEQPLDTTNDPVIKAGHDTLAFEQAMMQLVSEGDVAGITELIIKMPPGRTGQLSAEQLRQQKNTFIVAATLESRAAIAGGMEQEEAFSLSDAYIQRCELLNDIPSISNLQYRMVIDYTSRVEKLRFGQNPSRLVLDVANYVRRHLSDNIRTSNIAKSLFLSREHLSMRFSQETGVSLTEYIHQKKIEEAKRLLKTTNKSIAEIGNYLAYSSQSHFQNTFKRYTGETPGRYRSSVLIR